MIDRESTNIEAAEVLSREDGHGIDRPSPDEYEPIHVPRAIRERVAGYVVAADFGPTTSDDVPF